MLSWLDSERKGKCGANCYACSYYRVLCPGCITRICLVDRCIRGTSYTGITYPNAFCRLRDYCPIGGKQRPALEQIPETNAHQVKRADLPQFTPIISIADNRSWFWDTFSFPAIFVRLGELLTTKGLLDEVSKSGLHDYLGYDGKIALSTIMPDEIIDKLKPADYIRLVGDLRPDVAMVSDNHTYVDDPFYLSWSQTVRLVRYAAELRDLGVPVLGVVKGAISKQTHWCIEKQLQLGYTSFALPVRELAKLDLLDGYLTTTVHTLKEAEAKPELVVYGLSHRIRRLKEAKYATLSWYIHAKRRFIFVGEKTRSVLYPDIEYVPCDCPACNGARPYDLLHDVRRLSLHNLLQQKARLEGKAA
jgi:hypothetical protein